MIGAPSKEVREAFVWKEDIEREPEFYPKEVIAAFKEYDKNGLENIFPYDIEGYVITKQGVAGVHHNSPPHVKEEWLRFWKSMRDHPRA